MTTASFDTIFQSRADMVKTRFFTDASFQPLIGNAQSCNVYIVIAQENQPIGYETVTDIKIKYVVASATTKKDPYIAARISLSIPITRS